MGSDAPDDRCQMRDRSRPATRTMTLQRHRGVAVCDRYYRRNVALKYGVLAGLSVLLGAIGLAVHRLVG